MSQQIFGAVENGLTKEQFGKIVKFVEKNVFDGCGRRKLRAFYLLETGKFLAGNRTKTSHSYQFFRNYESSPITNIDRIIHNISSVTSMNHKYATWLRDKDILRQHLEEVIK